MIQCGAVRDTCFLYSQQDTEGLHYAVPGWPAAQKTLPQTHTCTHTSINTCTRTCMFLSLTLAHTPTLTHSRYTQIADKLRVKSDNPECMLNQIRRVQNVISRLML